MIFSLNQRVTCLLEDATFLWSSGAGPGLSGADPTRPVLYLINIQTLKILIFESAGILPCCGMCDHVTIYSIWFMWFQPLT